MNSLPFQLFAFVAPILAASTLVAAPAGAAILDFEQFGVTTSAGDIGGGSQNLTGEVVNLGGVDVTLGVSGTTPAGLPLTTFDASCVDGSSPTGGDDDLCQDGFNNILIVNENQNLSNPDDNDGFDVISFDFSEAVSLGSIDLIDNDNADPGSISAFLDGNSLGTLDLPFIADGSSETIDLSQFAFADSIEVTLVGSGALDNLSFSSATAIPEPTTLLGLALGGGALLAAKRQRRQ